MKNESEFLIPYSSFLVFDRRPSPPTRIIAMSSHRLLHLLRLSLHSLVVNRLRSVLTVLGIVLGVASVIVMLAIGEAARYEAIRQIELLGANNIIVRSVKPPDDNKQNPDQLLLTYGVTRLDMERLIATLPTVRAAT